MSIIWLELPKPKFFTRLLQGETIPYNDCIREACDATRKLLVSMNTESNLHKVPKLLSEVVGYDIDESTTL